MKRGLRCDGCLYLHARGSSAEFDWAVMLIEENSAA